MALNWNDLVQIQEKVREQAERRRDIVEEARQRQGMPVQEPQDNFTNLVQTESEEPQPEPQNTPTVEEQKKEETPVVQPVTEPVETKQEQEPVVQPVVVPKTNAQEETKQPEVVQANDTETLYNDWESYLAEQDRANAVIDTGTTTQPVEETPLVTPVQKVLGTYPAGTMDYLRENDLPIDWLNTEDGQYWLESRNTPQPEMLFPEDYGGTEIPNLPQSPGFGVEDFLNIGVRPAVAENYWNGYTRNSRGENAYEPTTLDTVIQGLVNQVGDNIVNSLQNSETPPWLNTDNIIANREYQGATYEPTEFDRNAKDVIDQIPGLIGNAIVNSLTNGTDNILANSADQIVANRDTVSTPYQPTEFDEAAKSVLQEIPGRIGNAIADSLSNGISNIASESADQIVANRERNNEPYQPTQLDNAVKDIIGDLIANGMDTNVPVPDVVGNRTPEEPNRFVNEEFNQSVKDALAPDWKSNFELNSPILSGTDPTLRPEPEFGTPEWYAENGLEWATNAPQTPQAPRTNGYTPVADLRDYPNIQGESNTESEQKPYLYNEQYLKDQDLGLVDDSFAPEELAELYGGTVESTTWDGTTGTPRTSGYERAERDFIEKPRTVYDAIADLVNNSGIDHDIEIERLVDFYIEDNNLEDTPELRNYLERTIEQGKLLDEKNGLKEEPTPVTGNDVKNTLSDMFNTAKDIASTVYTLNNPGQAIMNEVVKGASDFVNNTLQPGTDRIQIAEQAAIDAGYLPGTPEFDAQVDNILLGMSDKKSRLDEFNEQLLEQPRQERYYRGLENLSRNAMALEDQRLNNYRNSVDETYNNLVRAGWDPETAKMLALNNDLFGLYDKQGNYIGAKNPEQVYEAPAYNADGTPNATLQAILNGEYEIDGLKGSDLTQADYMPGGALHEDYATQILHSFDVNGGFWENGSVVIPKEIIDLMATDPSNAFGELFQTGFDANLDLTPVGRNAGNVQYANVTDEQWMAGVEAFIKANPALEKLITDGILTQDDIASHFFKAPISAKASGSKPKGSGSGYGYGRYGGGGGGGGYGGGGGGSSRGSSSAPSAKSQTEQRINNIMKNWTF